ncbi:MAG: 4Fe-4S dicluster domain-containing protein [Candidatus Adiutrix sp.]|jgi:formate hydrogenlyase subunit 6/NADH:ubiquinone oxidoreductase subunit I|nr:4Fe-4S dicluster domain-containing protein [Candidatus Adiutrix sp.]
MNVEEKLIPIYYLGQRYDVPAGLTIMTALEWLGYVYTHGCGCRGGACGACSTMYRVGGDYKLHAGLACQTMVVPGMTLVQIPYYPRPVTKYSIDEKITDPSQVLLRLFPAIQKCVGCGACARACPQNLRPIDYVAAALRGQWQAAADLSFDCLMCGLCAARCTGELVPHSIAMFVRRYYAKLVRIKPQYLVDRSNEIKSGKFVPGVKQLATTSLEELRRLYDARSFENVDGNKH